MKSPVLVIEGVTKRFGDVAVLRGVNAMVEEGSITAFVGPNGAGKTTLFHTVSGDLRPDAGTVVYRREPIGGSAPWKVARRGIGKLFQDVRVFENLTVLENVLLALHDHAGRSVLGSLRDLTSRRSAARKRAEAESCLAQVGLEAPYDRPAGTLSFGNRKLLALARLIAGKFQLLLLDEPAAGVSPPMAQRFAELLRAMIRERNVSICLIEHNFAFVSELADHAYVLRAGVIHDEGPPAEVLRREENREILVGI